MVTDILRLPSTSHLPASAAFEAMENLRSRMLVVSSSEKRMLAMAAERGVLSLFLTVDSCATALLSITNKS